MTSPKKALEVSQDSIAKTYGGDIVTPEYHDEVEDTIDDAISVAELHEQMEKLWPEILTSLTGGHVIKRKVREIRDQLEALK